MSAFIVKRGRHLYATGHGDACSCPVGCWTGDSARAFVFESAARCERVDTPRKIEDGRFWAEAHADELRKKLPKNERGHVHVVPFVEPKEKRASVQSAEDMTRDELAKERWTLLEGESLRILRELPDASVDAVICDPPYSSGGFTRGDRMLDTTAKYILTGRGQAQNIRPDFAGDNRDQRSFEYWCVLWLAEALRVAKPGSPICVFTDWRQLPVTTDAVQAGGWVWRGIVVWDKTTANVRPAMGRFSAESEFVVWGSAGAMPQRVDVGCLDGVIRSPVVFAEKLHTTGKPVEVMRELVKVCPPGGIVLDPFAGSGTTGVAALREGRRFLGVELVPHYAELARDRLIAEAQDSTLDAYRAGQAPLFKEPT